jgi:hypothetical protein
MDNLSRDICAPLGKRGRMVLGLSRVERTTLRGGRNRLEWVAGLDRNQWPDNFGMGGRFTSEWVAELARNTHLIPKGSPGDLKSS